MSKYLEEFLNKYLTEVGKRLRSPFNAGELSLLEMYDKFLQEKKLFT